MSFHITFAARTVGEARAKLNEHHAPAAVKALIEKAIDAIPGPRLRGLLPHPRAALRG